MVDRTAATVGFVLAGVALAAAVPGWAGGPGRAGVALSAGALVALALRRYGRLEQGPADAAAAGGGAGAAVAAAVAVVGVAQDGGTGWVGVGPATTAAAGLGAAVMAYADWRGVGRSRLAAMGARTLTATAIGLAGLLAILAWSYVVVSAYLVVVGEADRGTQVVLTSLALGLGTGTVAWLYLRGTDRGLGFVDVRRPTRRDGAIVVGGIAVLLAVNLGIGFMFRALGLPAAQHTIFDIAREDPELLLVLIPLSILLIGPGEELLYRNVVQKSLYGAFSRPAAVVVASAIFAAAHVPAYSSAGSTPLSVLNTLAVVFALSVVLGVAFDRTRNVVVPALIHGSFNAIAFAATYVELVG